MKFPRAHAREGLRPDMKGKIDEMTDNSGVYVRRSKAARVLGIHPETLGKRLRKYGVDRRIRTAKFGARQEVRYNLIDIFALVYPDASEDKRAELRFKFLTEISPKVRARPMAGRRRDAQAETAGEKGHPEDARTTSATEFGHTRIPTDRESRKEELLRMARELSKADQRRKVGLPAGDVPLGSRRSGQLIDMFAVKKPKP
jgi:hypothetical protein